MAPASTGRSSYAITHRRCGQAAAAGLRSGRNKLKAF
jgi:hypothetical protein